MKGLFFVMTSPIYVSGVDISGRSLEMRLEVALAAEGLPAALALELVRVHVEVVCKDQNSF